MKIHGKKTDRSQQQIVKDLRASGIQVEILSEGCNKPDLLCGYNGVWALIEIKESDGSVKRGQLKFLSEAKGSVGVATNYEDAYNMAVTQKGCLLEREKKLIDQWLVTHEEKTISVKKFWKLIGR